MCIYTRMYTQMAYVFLILWFIDDYEEVWSEESNEDIEDEFSGLEETPPSLVVQEQESTRNVSKVLCDWIIAFFIHLQVVFYVPDLAMEAMLKFLSVFLVVLGTVAPQCAEMSKLFPSSVHKLKTYMGIYHLSKLKNYVVCRKCHQIYDYKDCVLGCGSSLRSISCPFRAFPHHRQRRMRMECGTLLLKTVELSSGRKVLYPFLTYCYMGLKCSLESLILTQQFVELSEHWRSRDDTSGKLCDIYDGKIWSEFQQYDDRAFLSDPYTFGLMMNIDWFRPYKHVQNYSVGAIYLVFMNLPRHLRFKRENVLLLGILPGPSEPSHDINSYLTPLVNELK